MKKCDLEILKNEDCVEENNKSLLEQHYLEKLKELTHSLQHTNSRAEYYKDEV